MSYVQQRTGRPVQQKFGNRNINRGNNQNKNFTNRNNFNNNRFPNKGAGQTHINGAAPKPNRDAIIRQNLQHMEQVAQKKRVAQERYYGNGRSPMIKTTSGPFIKQEARPIVKQENRIFHNNRPFIRQDNRPNRPFIKQNRPFVKQANQSSIQQRLSVQQRLGNRKPNFQNNNTTKKQIIINTRPNTNRLPGGMRSDKMVRIQNMNQKRTRFPNTNGAIKTVNSAGKVVYLQPVRKQPANYTVRVDNDRKHHVAQGLNPVLQQEIKMIQGKNSRQIVTPVAPAPVQPALQNVTNSYDVDRLPIVATNRTLHERFSMI